MTEEIRLIAEARHLKRYKGVALMSLFFGACTLCCGLLGASCKKYGRSAPLAVTGVSAVVVVCGQNRLKKISQKERIIHKRLSQIQRERS